MAIYRFRVLFEDYDEIIREIDMLSNHSFLDFHIAIQNAVGYNPEYPSSFYISNDQWKKGEEFAYLPSENKIKKGVILMENTRLNKFIDDPHQKFYYAYNFEHPIYFHIQLIKILKEEEGKNYPTLFKSIGKAPKSTNNSTLIDETSLESSDEDEKNEFDFFNEMAYEAAEDEENNQGLLDEDNENGEFPEQSSSEDEY